ncbi:transposase [uncultured Ruminococcus sp.]|uniref:transposase n=1 Tax=uncultured Ruminococcus sp. TaxID=165186 RepID=UPI0025D664BB|nr:transposase [uncultured Ruminococcus sp.]
MRNCQVRLNMNYEIYQKEEYTIVSKWNGAIPEDIMMKILIYGYMNDSFSSRKIEQLCKRDIHFMWLLDGFGAPDHSNTHFYQSMDFIVGNNPPEFHVSLFFSMSLFFGKLSDIEHNHRLLLFHIG